MVDKVKLLERLMATFLDELDEHVRVINDELLALEKTPDDDEGGERLTRLFRAAHSLKGAARAVDQPGIEQVCHRIEDVFTGFREGRIHPTPEVCAVLFDVADAIESAGMQLREKTPVNHHALEKLLPRLEAAAAGHARSELGRATPASGAESPQTEQDRPSASEPSELQPQTAAEDVGPASPIRRPTGRTPSPPTASSLPTTIRVAEEKLDSLLAQSGELLVARQQVEARPRDVAPLLDAVTSWRVEWRNIVGTLRQLVAHDQGDRLVRRSSRLRERAAYVIEQNGERLALLEERLERLAQGLIADARQLKLASSALQDDIHRIRMLPFAQACHGLERAVHDVCRASRKEAELIIEGGDIEVDRSVLEGLGDPLLHLVRNAVDHGIESPAQRKAAGKAVPATITVTATIHGAEVDVIVADDGQGLNLQKIRQRLRQQGLPEPDADRDLARCVFLPGFSTADAVTDVSGRGVGMDVVKSRIESLHGRIDIASEPGLGTRFTLSVPLTLTTVSALFVHCGGQAFAFPTSTVGRLVRFERSALRQQQGQMVLPLGRVPIRVVSLAEILRLPPVNAADGMQTAVLGTVGERQMLFVVEEVLAEQEAVIKSLGPRIRHVPHVSGAITLRSGHLALLLNTNNLIRSVEGGGAETFTAQFTASSADRETASSMAPARRVLVVDDSMTTRTLLKSILETAGYDVLAVPDGQDAWECLQNETVDVVVTDIDMPRMDGFELTEAIRHSPDQGQLPVILVTSRDSDADKRRGVEVGADAYLPKSSFDQSAVLETVEQFL